MKSYADTDLCIRYSWDAAEGDRRYGCALIKEHRTRTRSIETGYLSKECGIIIVTQSAR